MELRYLVKKEILEANPFFSFQSMQDKIENNKIKEIELLVEEIRELGPMMRGSITIIGKKNKQPYFSVGINGKTKIMYLGEKRTKIARKYTENYKKTLVIIDKMTIANMTILESMKTK